MEHRRAAKNAKLQHLALRDAPGQRTQMGFDFLPPEPSPDLAPGDAMAASGYFDAIQRRHYLWSTHYDADSYIALLNTFSGHIAMDPAHRDTLYRQIRHRLRSRADHLLLRRDWEATLTVGTRTERPTEGGHGTHLLGTRARVIPSPSMHIRGAHVLGAKATPESKRREVLQRPSTHN